MTDFATYEEPMKIRMDWKEFGKKRTKTIKLIGTYNDELNARMEMKLWQYVCQEYTATTENNGNELRIERTKKRKIYNDLKVNQELMSEIREETIEEMKKDDEKMMKNPKLTRRQKEMVKMEIENELEKLRRTRPINEEMKIKILKEEMEKKIKEEMEKKILEKFDEEDEEDDEYVETDDDEEEEEIPIRVPSPKSNKNNKTLTEENTKLKDELFKMTKMMERLMTKMEKIEKKYKETKKEKMKREKKQEKLIKSFSDNFNIKED